MARLRRAARLETREARTRLTLRREPYWRQLERGLSLGYRRAKTGGSWIVRRFVNGRYVIDRLAAADDFDDANGTDVLDYAQAQRRALEKADMVVRGGDPLYTVGDALRDYMDWYTMHRKGVEQTEAVVRGHLLPQFGARRVEALTTREIRDWHQGLAKKRSKATANRILTVLKAALNRAWEDGYAASADAWQRVKPFRGADAARVRFLTEDDCQRLINACERDFRALVRGALLTGCRYGELCVMRVEDYHLDAGTVSVRDSKSGKPRHVPLTEEGDALFGALTAGEDSQHALVFTQADGTPWARYLQVRRIREASARAKIKPPAKFHILRHTYGSLLAMRGVPLHVIAEAMGHADARMTSRHYAHLMPSYVADTIRANLPTFGSDESNVERIRRGRPSSVPGS